MTTVLLLSDDLIDTSRITGTAGAVGVEAKAARSRDRLLELIREASPDCVMVDLQHSGMDIADLMATLRREELIPHVIAYGSHVQVEALRAARQAGCDRVMPRSQFFEELARATATWFSALGANDD